MCEQAIAKRHEDYPIFRHAGSYECIEEIIQEQRVAPAIRASLESVGIDQDLETLVAGGSAGALRSQPAPFATPKAQQGQNGVSTVATSAPQLLAWLDTEVKARLVTVDTKLDRLLQYAGNPRDPHSNFLDGKRASNSASNFLDTTRLSTTHTKDATIVRSALAPVAAPVRPPPPTQSCPRLSNLSTHSHHIAINGRTSTESTETQELHCTFGERESFAPEDHETKHRVQIASDVDTMNCERMHSILSSYRNDAHNNHHGHKHITIQSHDSHSRGEHSHLGSWAMAGSARSIADGADGVHRRHQTVLNNFIESAKHMLTGVGKVRGRFSNAFLVRGRKPEKEKGVLRQAHVLWHFLEDSESSTPARWYAEFMNVFIVTSVFLTVVQTSEPPIIHGWGAAIWESTVDSVLLLEFFVRFIVCPSWVIFMTTPFNILDLMLGLVLALRVAAGLNLDEQSKDSIWTNFFLLFLPTLRMMKTLRRFQTLNLIFKAFEQAVEALPVLLWTLMVAVMIFSTLIYWLEPRENIPTWTNAIWLTIVTMSTVGYGDVSPVSPGGTIVTVCLIIVSVLYMAMPIGIIGQTFGSIWHDRDRILLMQQTRKRLLQWGYTAEDIPIIFSLFDEDDDEELDLPEFRKMIKEMGLGIREERVLALFDSLDVDSGGSIDDKEFVRNVFPKEFHRLYQVDAEQAEEISRCQSHRRRSTAIGLGMQPINPLLQRAKTLEKLGRLEHKQHFHDSEQPVQKKLSLLSGVSGVSHLSRHSKHLSKYVRRHENGEMSDAANALARRLSARSHVSAGRGHGSMNSEATSVCSRSLSQDLGDHPECDADEVGELRGTTDACGSRPVRIASASGFTIVHAHDAPGDF